MFRGGSRTLKSSISTLCRIHEKELGDHPETAVILNNLAELYAKKGNLQQAESFYMKKYIGDS